MNISTAALFLFGVLTAIVIIVGLSYVLVLMVSDFRDYMTHLTVKRQPSKARNTRFQQDG